MTVADTIQQAAQSAKEAVGLGTATSGESKSARKKKAKAEAATSNGNTTTDSTSTAVPKPSSQENSIAVENTTEQHEYIKELNKQIRNTNKKLQATQKADSIVLANPGVSLDDLVAQRLLNKDQREQLQKKPKLQAQLADLEERAEHYRGFDAKYQEKFAKQREELTAEHERNTSKLREQLSLEGASSAETELRKKLLVFSQFLRAAAAKRAVDEETDSEVGRAFEGALLQVYGGGEEAVDAAMKLIEGSQELVPGIDSVATNVPYAQVKEESLKHAPFQQEEAWLEGVVSDAVAPSGSDPTIAHAGLTELEAPNGTAAASTLPEPVAAQGSSGEGGNIAGERWDTDAAGTSAGAEKSGLDESYEIVPRPNEEVDVPAAAPVQAQHQSNSWAEESHEAATGNKAGESWDSKAPGETNGSFGAEPVATANGWAEAPTSATPADDGFSPVAGRRGGRGNPRARGDGEFRRGGRGGNYRGRGDGENRGRGRGGFRGGRGEGGGRARGPRAGAPAPVAS